MVDVIIVIVMILFMLSGYKKGLISEAIALISTIVSLILAVLAYPVMNMILKSLGMQQWIEKQVSRLNLENFNLGFLKELVGENLGLIMMSLLAIVIVWLIIRIVLRGVLKVVGVVIGNLPIISSVNHLAGLILGFLKGFLILSITVLILPFLMMSDFTFIEQLQSYINESELISIFYEYNLAIWLARYFIRYV